MRCYVDMQGTGPAPYGFEDAWEWTLGWESKKGEGVSHRAGPDFPGGGGLDLL